MVGTIKGLSCTTVPNFVVIGLTVAKIWRFFSFWATICKTVRPMLSDRCLSVLSVCDIRALWPNGWTDQDETWHVARPRP